MSSGQAEKPRQSISVATAVFAYFLAPGLMAFAFLSAWSYPPDWVWRLAAFGPPVVVVTAFVAVRAHTGLQKWAPLIAIFTGLFAGVHVLRHSEELQVFDWTALMLFAAAVATGVGVLSARLLQRRPMKRRHLVVATVTFAVLAGSYVYGLVAVANALIEPRPHASFEARITDKRHSGGRHSQWRLYLGPWGPEGSPSTLTVSSAVYDSLGVGDIACIDLHRGWLGFRWYDARHCRFSELNLGPRSGKP